MLPIHRIHVRRLWREDNVGLMGFIGAELEDGTLVALCSVEKWILGSNDSLRKQWKDNERKFVGIKTIYGDVTEMQLRKDGLGSGKLKLVGRPIIRKER